MNRSESKYFNTAVRMDQALMALLEEKPFDYITVSEICKRAGVHRSTFYLHYETIQDLLEETSDYLIDSFQSYFSVDHANLTDRFANCPLSDLNFITREYLEPYLTYIRDNAWVFATAAAHAKTFQLDRVFQRLFQAVFDPILERFHYPPAYRRYVMLFYLNGIHGLIGEWLRGGCQTPIAEMTAIIRACVLGEVER